MRFPDRYKIMPGNSYSLGKYKLIPIRYEDRLEIMRWRNEQIYHLRQKDLLTEEQQDKYFSEVVAKLFDKEYPDQILFSYLENDKCIGYGGLVHIDWYSKNAEISFIIDPELEKESFEEHWVNYLALLYKYAFDELNLHKVYTYAFDLRPHLYKAIEKGGLAFEARLKEHFLFEGEYKDVVIHSKLNENFKSKEIDEFYLKEADKKDTMLLFNWANDPSVRKNAFNTEPIEWEQHQKWIQSKLASSYSKIFILYKKDLERPLGQIRLDYMKENDVWLIDYSIDKFFRGLKLSTVLFKLITNG